MNSVDKFSFDEIDIMLNAVCHKLDFMVQNDKQHTARYKSFIKLRDKLCMVVMDMDKEIEKDDS